MKTIRVLLVVILLASLERSQAFGRRGQAPSSQSGPVPDAAPAGLSLAETKTALCKGLIKVQFSVANPLALETPFEYSIQWFDELGMKIPSFPGGWSREVALANDLSYVQEFAPSKQAVYFSIKLREIAPRPHKRNR